MALDKKSLVVLYRKRAKHYDISANSYYLLGIREFAYRKLAVEDLKLNRGDTVVELGCGTGLNFRLLRDRVGPAGRIVGVDLTAEMLSTANKRIERNNWTNIELIECDAVGYDFPERVEGIISTFAITLIPDYDKIIKKGLLKLL